MRVTREAVIQAASQLADQKGLNQVSLKEVAQRLGIRTPSLYNHVESLDDLLRKIAHRGMRDMNGRMTDAAVGGSGDAAIQSVSVAYFDFMMAHPGVYETIQWAAWHGNDETAALLAEYRALLKKLVLSCRLKMPDPDEIVNLLMGALHGYSTLCLGFALANPEEAVIGLCNAVDTILLGIHKKYD